MVLLYSVDGAGLWSNVCALKGHKMVKNIHNYLNKFLKGGELKNTLDSCGGFHDALVNNICISSKQITINIDDLLANFDGYDTYETLNNVKLIFGILRGSINLALNEVENLKIFDIELNKKNDLTISFSPSGRIEFLVESLYIKTATE